MKFNGTIKSVFFVKELEATAAYYTDVYGLPILKEHPGFCEIGMLKNGAIQLRRETPDLAQGPGSLWIEARDVDKVFEDVQRHPRANIFEPVEDKYYHARVFRVIDPSGNAMAVVTYEKDLGTWTGEVRRGAYFKDEFRSVMFVDDLDACYRFYTEKLGMKCVYSWDEGPGDRGFKYQIAEGSDAYLETLHRIPLMPQGKVTIEFETPDLEACYAELSADKEVKVLNGITTDADGSRYFRFLDPDGNAVVLREHLS